MRGEKIKFMAHELGLRVRAARLSRGLTAEETAEKIGVSTKTYGNMERGETGVSLGTFLAAVELLDLDLAEALPSSAEVKGRRTRRTPKIDEDEVDF